MSKKSKFGLGILVLVFGLIVQFININLFNGDLKDFVSGISIGLGIGLVISNLNFNK